MTQDRDTAPVTRSRPPRMGSQHIRVLLVDDHTLLRQALRVMLETQDGIEIVGEATNGRDAVDAVDRLRPDVVLMVMPGLNGIEATRQIIRNAPTCRTEPRTLCN